MGLDVNFPIRQVLRVGFAQAWFHSRLTGLSSLSLNFYI